MRGRSKEAMDLIDEYLYDKCQERSPGENRKYIDEYLRVYSFTEAVSHVFYKHKYILTIDWRQIV